MSIGHTFYLLLVDLVKLMVILGSYFAGQDIIKDENKRRTKKQIIFLILKVVGVGLFLAWVMNSGNASDERTSEISLEFFFLISVPCIIGIVEKQRQKSND